MQQVIYVIKMHDYKNNKKNNHIFMYSNYYVMNDILKMDSNNFGTAYDNFFFLIFFLLGFLEIVV